MAFVKRKGKGKGGGGRITAWSFSRWKTWRDCPRKAFYKFIERREEPQGEAAARGQAVHEDAERYLRKDVRTLPPSLVGTEFAARIRDLRKKAATPEAQLAFTRDWIPTEWFAKDAWCRVKPDARLPVIEGVARSIDFKTGKVREEEHRLQAELQCVGELLTERGATLAVGQMWYLDSGDLGEEQMYRCDLESALAGWEERVRPMLVDTKFEERPGRQCSWCHFSRAKGGPCRY